MTQVLDPNGNPLEFPDEMSMADIKSVMQKKFPAPQDNSPTGIQDQVQRLQKPSFLEKFQTGAGDIMHGVGQIMARAPIGAPGSAPIAQQPEVQQQASDYIDKETQQREQAWQARRAATGDTGIEWARGLGAGVASLPAAMLLPESAAASLPGALGRGFIQGAALNSLNPVTDPSKGSFENQKLKQVAIGGATGMGTNAAFHGLGNMISPQVDPNIQYLRDRGVEPTLGQNIGPSAAKAEDALSTVNPFIGMGQRRAVQQFNRATYNEALKPLEAVEGQSVEYTGPVGRKGIAAIGDRLSQAYEDIKPRISLAVDDGVLGDIGKIADDAATTTQDLSDKFQRFISKDVISRVDDTGTLTGDAFKKAESALTERASDYAKSALTDDRTLAKHLYDAADVLRDHLAANNPEDAAKLKAINNGWAILTRIEKAAATSPATDNGVFTPAQLSRAVETMDNTVRHRQYVRGEALLQPLSDAGSQILGNRYPNSGTFGRSLAGGMALGGGAMAGGTAAGAATLGAAPAAGIAASGLAYSPMGQRALGAIINGQRGVAAPALSGLARRTGLPAISALIYGTRP